MTAKTLNMRKKGRNGKDKGRKGEKELHLCNAGALFELGVKVLVPVLEERAQDRREGDGGVVRYSQCEDRSDGGVEL